MDTKEPVLQMVHDLRTPLSAIKWSVEHLRLSDLSSLGPDEREDIESINKEVEHMAMLIDAFVATRHG